MRVLSVAVIALCVLLSSCGEAPGPEETPVSGEPAGNETATEDTEQAEPLSTIVRILEFQGYTAIAEAVCEGEYWEVEAFKDGERFKLNVDPVHGKILSVAEPSYPMPLSEILTELGEQGYGPVVELELGQSDDEEPLPVWEIQVYKGSHAVFLSVDAATGEILSED